MNETKVRKNISKILIEIIQEELTGIKEIAIPFSGSLDSSLIAYIVKKYTKTDFKLYTIGFPGCYDFSQVDITCNLLNMKTKKIILTQKVLDENLKEYLDFSNDKDKVSVSFTLPFYILLQSIGEKNIISALGADTLFGGFHKYLTSNDLKRDIKSCYEEFKSKLDIREYPISKKFDKNLIVPLAEDKLSQEVMKLPENLFIKNGVRKYFWREIAKYLGIPKEISMLPKKSFQYSTGVRKRLKLIQN